MLTAELRKNIDEKWAACWPTNTLKPIVLLDLISYLLFIKTLEENQLLTAMPPPKQGGHFLNAKEKKEPFWSIVKDMDAQSMLAFFVKEKGISYQLNQYSNTNLKYSLFVKEPLVLTPTARILGNMVDIIKIMDREAPDTRATIFEYLLNKSEIIGQNGQVFAPDYVVKLMVDMMRPSHEDFIGDPSAANGSFLVTCKKYVARNFHPGPDDKNDMFPDRLKGMECDPIHLRIAAMNMLLHGIEDPQLEGLNILDNSNVNLRQQPTFVLSNLFFKSPEISIVAGENLQPKNVRPEINLLNLIVKNLRRDGRAAIIIRDLLLSENSQDIKTIRQQIIDDHKLEAVIFLSSEQDSLFSGACIIVFTNPEFETTDKVWFYKMDSLNAGEKTASEITNQRFQPGADFEEKYIDTREILRHWDLAKNKRGEEEETDNSFYVPVDEIKNKNYSLSFRQYHRVKKEHNSGQLKPVRENRKTIILRERAKRKRTILRLSLLIICVAAITSYVLFFKHNWPISFYAATKYELPSTPAAGRANSKNLPAKDSILAQVARKVASGDEYTVIAKAYFHNSPDENSRRNSYMTHSNNVILHPIEEKNGYIYVVYTNHHGQIIKGWLNKKDLKPL